MNFLKALDLLGTFTAAVSGAIAASRTRMDLFGALFIALLASVGGGTARDLMLGATPVFWLKDGAYFAAAGAGALATILFARPIRRYQGAFLAADALGLAIFTVIGLQKGLEAGLAPVFAVAMGVTTGILGGVIRDLVCNDIPVVLRKEIYAVAAIAGGSCYFLVTALGGAAELAQAATVAVTIAIRLLSLHFGWSLPLMRGE